MRRCPLFVLLLAPFSQTACHRWPDDSTAPARTELDSYVAEPDAVYGWELLGEVQAGECRASALELTSQSWRSQGDVDETVWRHLLWVVEPPGGGGDTALLFVSGGERGETPEAPAEFLVQLSLLTGCVVAQVRGVPNQPLMIGGDGERRWEDDLVARTWVEFLETGDPEWAIRLPMVKSGVRAMDAVQEFLAGGSTPETAPSRFVVAGASKRGWTTWLVGAVDDRVAGIVPIVIDVLDVVNAMRHHYSAYGFWAPAVGDYVHHGIPERMGEPRFADLMELVDPFAYRHRLDVPRYAINASGDQFFLPDSSRFYWDSLPLGQGLLRYVPNADHSLGGTDALLGLAAWTRRVANGERLPVVTTGVDADDALWIRADERPFQARLWRAANPRARDFRLEEIGAVWEASPLPETADGVWGAPAETPGQGFAATFLELSFGSPELPLTVTSQVQVRPDTLPFLDESSALEAEAMD